MGWVSALPPRCPVRDAGGSTEHALSSCPRPPGVQQLLVFGDSGQAPFPSEPQPHKAKKGTYS